MGELPPKRLETDGLVGDVDPGVVSVSFGLESVELELDRGNGFTEAVNAQHDVITTK